MAENPAVNGPLPVDSPHVMAFTNTRRGMTPPVWEDGKNDGYAGVWEAVTPGGPADCSGETASGFDDGPGRWTQI